MGCNTSFHIQCALDNNCSFHYFEGQIFCAEHSKPQEPEQAPIPAHKIKEVRPPSPSPEPEPQPRPRHSNKHVYRLVNRSIGSQKQLRYQSLRERRRIEHTQRIRSRDYNDLWETIDEFYKPYKHPRKLSLEKVSNDIPKAQLTKEVSCFLIGPKNNAYIRFQLMESDIKVFKMHQTETFKITPKLPNFSAVELTHALKKKYSKRVGKKENLTVTRQINRINELNKYKFVKGDDISREIAWCTHEINRMTRSTRQILNKLSKRSKQTSTFNADHREKILDEYRSNLRWGFINRSLKRGIKDKQEAIEGFEEDDEVYNTECCICFDLNEEESMLNPLYYCRECKIYTHRACYGDYPDDIRCHKCYENQTAVK